MPAPSPKVTNRPAPPAKALMSAPKPAPAGGAQKGGDTRDAKAPALPPSLRVFSPAERAKERKRAEEGMKAPPLAKDAPAAASAIALPANPTAAASASPGTPVPPTTPNTPNTLSPPLAGSPDAARGTPPATAPKPAAPPPAVKPLPPPQQAAAKPAAGPAGPAPAASAKSPVAAATPAPKPAGPAAASRRAATADSAPGAQQEGERGEEAAQNAAAPEAANSAPAAENTATAEPAAEPAPAPAAAAAPGQTQGGPPLPGEDSNTVRSAPAAAGATVARSATSQSRIANAEPTTLQAQALVQAQRVSSDCQQSEATIRQLAETRRRQVDAFVATLQSTVSAFFARSLQNVQAFIMEKQAALMAALQRTLVWITQTITGGLQSAQEWVTQARINLQSRISSLSNGLQSRVSSVTGRLTGLIDSVPLPDLPGVERVRGAANSLLRGGGRLVNGALSIATRTINSVIGAGFSAINALLAGFTRVLGSVLGMLTGVLTNLLQALMHAFNLCLQAISNLLLHLLNAIVLPLFARIGRLARRWIDRLEMRAIATLRENRERTLEMLADAVVPEVAAATPPDNPDDTPESQTKVLEQIRLDALQRAQLVVRLFDFLSGDAFRILLSLTRALAVTIQSAIADMVRNAASFMGNIVARCLEMLGNVVRLIGQLVSQLGQFLRQSLSDLIDSAARILLSPISAAVSFADTAYSRLSGSVNALVANFLRSITGGAPSSSGLVGNYLVGPVGPLRGPIVKPAPGTIDWIVKVAAPIVVAAVKALVKLVGPKAALVIIVIILIVIVLLLLYLLWLLLKWLWDVITKPKKPKKPKKRVIRVTPKRLELGVGGSDLATRATISFGRPLLPPLTWTVNPGGSPPTGVSVIGTGRNVKLRSAHPPHNTVLGGTAFTVRAALAANPLDFADSAPITLIQILSANYSANPPLAPVPSAWPGTPEPNTGEPNRDGITGNTIDVNAFVAPSGRSMRLEFRRSLGASISALTVKPGSQTGDIGLRIMDRVTGAQLDDTLPSTSGPAPLMSDVTVNAVPLKVSGLTTIGIFPPPRYGVVNTISFTPSDTQHAPLTRIVGELIGDGGNGFNMPPPNNGFNPNFDLQLAVPANHWDDQLWTHSAAPNVSDGQPAIDVNRFVGVGVPQLPRRLIYTQGMQYSAWHGAGSVVSRTFARGRHIRSLVGTPATGFSFVTEHVFGSVSTPAHFDAYIGNPLIDFSNLVVTPNAPGATALAADNASTATVTLNTTVAGRPIDWRVITGDLSFSSANPSLPPATLRAGNRSGNFAIRASDQQFSNREIKGRVPVDKVVLANMRAADPVVPVGTMSTTVSLDARPGGRTVGWAVDAAAAAAGVTVSPPSTGPGAPAMTVTVTRPAGFTGRVTLTAADSVLTARTARVRIKFD